VRGKRDGTALGIQRERERDECGEKRDRTALGISDGMEEENDGRRSCGADGY
jgi:hypothetical protein